MDGRVQFPRRVNDGKGENNDCVMRAITAWCDMVLDCSVVGGRQNKLPFVFIANKLNCENIISDLATVAQNTSYHFYWNVHGAQEQCKIWARF